MLDTIEKFIFPFWFLFLVSSTQDGFRSFHLHTYFAVVLIGVLFFLDVFIPFYVYGCFAGYMHM